MKPNCVSCDILAGKRTSPGGTIYENDHWHVDSVIAPVYWQGFLIIKLKRHCEHLADLTPAEAASLGPTIQLTCQALTAVLDPGKVYICSIGDGVKHIHFWALPRPRTMRPGMRRVSRHLNMRAGLTRLGFKRWVYSDDEVAVLAGQLRRKLAKSET